MRRPARIVATVAIATLVATTPLAADSAAAGRTTTQEVRGSVLAPGPLFQCLYLEALAVTTVRARGAFVYSFPVDPKTHGRPFLLKPDLPADLAIFFAGGGFYDAHELEERGVVPFGATTAYVCITAGGPSSFTYRAG